MQLAVRCWRLAPSAGTDHWTLGRKVGEGGLAGGLAGQELASRRRRLWRWRGTHQCDAYNCWGSLQLLGEWGYGR